jgi:hypothetical protein
MTRAERESPADAGRRWAEEKCARLVGSIAARDWPEVWSRAFDAVLEVPEEVSETEASSYREAAHHAASERWLELLLAQRDVEAADEVEIDDELLAEKVLAKVRGSMPAELTVARDATGVFVSDDRRDLEVPVSSLEDAWRVVSEWDERYTR